MKINISELNKTKGGTDFSYNDDAEDAVINALCHYYDLQSNGGTVGYDPRYDKLVKNTKIEIKISKNPGIFIEFAEGDTYTDSGIMTTESDLYLTVNPGKDKDKDCMKVRLYYTAEIKHWVKRMKEMDQLNVKYYAASNLGRGSTGYMLDMRFVKNDLYALGFEYSHDKNGNIIFDSRKVLEPSSFARLKINEYIK